MELSTNKEYIVKNKNYDTCGSKIFKLILHEITKTTYYYSNGDYKDATKQRITKEDFNKEYDILEELYLPPIPMQSTYIPKYSEFSEVQRQILLDANTKGTGGYAPTSKWTPFGPTED